MKDSYIWYKEKISGEYLENFDKIELYGMVSNIDNDFFEERMMDLADMFMIAEAEGRPVEKLIGKDMEEFCEDFFERTLGEKMIGFFKRWIILAWVVLVTEILFFVPEATELTKGDSVWGIKGDIGGVVLGLLIGFTLNVIFAIVKPIVFKSKKLTSGKFSTACMIAFIVLLVLGVNFFELSVQIPSLISIIATAAYLIMYYSINAYCNYKRSGSNRGLKTWKRSFWREVNSKVEDDLPKHG